jgi:hypothetical protein
LRAPHEAVERGDKEARSSVKHAANRVTSFSRNCSSNVEMIGKPVGLIWVIPGVLRTNDVVKRKVALAIAAPTADTVGIPDPMIRAAAVVSSIVPTTRASPLTPNTPNQLMNGLCAINGVAADE